MKLYKKISFTAILLIFVGLSLIASAAFAASQMQSTVDNTDEPAIVGGTEAAPGAWPWMVALVHTGSSAFDGQFCGGSLIHAQYVLTAAHCTYTQDSPNSSEREMLPSEVFVIVGDYRLTDVEGQRINVKRIIRHPGYVSATQDNDLALFELVTPANPANTIDLIAADRNDLLSEGRMSTVIGWGLTIPNNNSAFPDVLRQVSVPIVPLEACWDSYGLINGEVTVNMLCAGLIEGGKDSCQGDSGGPLMTFDGSTQLWKQIGIVSWGTGCAEPKYYGIYTNLSKYAAWISEQIPTLNTPVPTFTATESSTPTASDTPTPTNTPSATDTPTASTTPLPTDVSPNRKSVYLPIIRRQNIVDTPTPTATVEILNLTNGDFEQGQSGWRESSVHNQTLIRSDNIGVTPHSGTQAVHLLGVDNEVAYVAQRVTIPSGVTILTYWYQSHSGDDCGYDFGGVVVNRNTVLDSIELCTSKQQQTWQQRTVDLSSYAGQTIEIALRGETDTSLSSELWIDDVAFLSGTGR
ncbi:MAG: trypsin-like serine protease [Caldilineaceae bacterium]